MLPITRRHALTLLASACLGLAVPRGAAATTQDGAAKGHELLLAGKPAQALEILREAARQDPANPWVQNLLGRAYILLGDAYHARESFRAALRLDQNDGYSRFMLDRLAQKPVPVPRQEPGAVKRRRPSQLETDARKELDAYASGQSVTGRSLVLIDPGHGGTDRGLTGASGLAEKVVTLDLARKLSAALDREGVRSELTREADYDLPLWARSALAGLTGADLLVSLHCSASMPGIGGLELFTYSPAPSDVQAQAVAEMENGVTRFERFPAPLAPPASARNLLASWQARRLAARGKETAERLAAALKDGNPLVGLHSRTAPLVVLGKAACPAVLVEAGHLSEPKEEELLKNREFLERLALFLAKGLTRSLG